MYDVNLQQGADYELSDQGRVHGGGEHLPSRVVAALRLCQEHTGATPTARKYGEWRNTLPEDARSATPSLTAVVPIAFPTWSEARRAAGMDQGTSNAHGPKPTWSAEDCWDTVVEWMRDDDPPYTFVKYNEWVQAQRASGNRTPSVSTVRLRLRRPWSGITAEAARRAGGTSDEV